MIQTLKKIWEYSFKRRKNLVSALVLSFINSTLGISQIFAIIVAVQVLLGHIVVKTGIIEIGILTIICIVGNFIVSYFEQINVLESGMYMTADLRCDVARQLRKMPLGFFQKAQSERIIATLTSTLQGVEMASSMSLIMIVSGFFNAIAMFIFMMFYEWRIALICGVGIILYLLVVRWQMILSRKEAPLRQKAQTNLASSSLTFLQGIKVIKAYSYKNSDEQLIDAINESSKENINLTSKSMPSQFAANFVVALFEGLILLTTIYLSFNLNSIDVEKTIVLLIFSFFAYASLNQAGSVLSMIGMIESGVDEIEEIKKNKVLEISESNQTMDNEEIILNNVSFSYGTNEVIHDVNLTFKPHTLTAIIGPSGSGKTTLCRLIARYQDIDKGSISIGGVDITKIPYEKLMANISMVFQNVYLFEDTILNNVRLGNPNATLEEVKKACKQARADKFIEALDDGYNTMVQEGGNNLSGGEKQRISIARAILKDAPIIILDEATSALDSENEKAFFEAIDELIKNKTVIMIAHRISTLKYADNVIAIKDGRVVQNGSPKELAQQDGLYKNFLKAREDASLWQISNK